jgi:hypothetical protein
LLAGGDPMSILETMGHANIQTTMRYVHHVPKVAAAQQLTMRTTG